MPRIARLLPCAPWLGNHTVSRPSASQAAAAARTSRGAAATRWLTISAETTTAQSGKASSICPRVVVVATSRRGRLEGRRWCRGRGRAGRGRTGPPVGRRPRAAVRSPPPPARRRPPRPAVLREHDGHRLTDEADDVPREQRLGHRLRIGAHHGPLGGHRSEVVSREDREDARRGGGRRDVHGRDPRGGDRRPDERGMHRAGQSPVVEVIGVDRPAGKECRILHAGHPRTQNAARPGRRCRPIRRVSHPGSFITSVHTRGGTARATDAYAYIHAHGACRPGPRPADRHEVPRTVVTAWRTTPRGTPSWNGTSAPAAPRCWPTSRPRAPSTSWTPPPGDSRRARRDSAPR